MQHAHRNLVGTDRMLRGSIERLSSGLRVNSAADDPAGLVISEQMRSQADGIAQSIRNAQDGTNLVKTAEAALTHDFGYYLLSVGLAHSHRTHGPGGVVPAHLMVGAMSLTQTALAQLFASDLEDAQEAVAASVAWNKLLLVQLNILLLGYLPTSRERRPA